MPTTKLKKSEDTYEKQFEAFQKNFMALSKEKNPNDIAQSSCSQWLSNKADRKPSSTSIQKICMYYEVSADWLLGYIENDLDDKDKNEYNFKNPKKMGEQLEVIRKELGFNKKTEILKKIGLNRSTYDKYLKGINYPEFSVLCRIKDNLQIDLDVLLGFVPYDPNRVKMEFSDKLERLIKQRKDRPTTISPQTLHTWVKNKNLPSYNNLKILCTHYKVSADWLLKRGVSNSKRDLAIDTKESFGNILKKILEEQNLTQENLCESLKKESSWESNISNYITGKKLPGSLILKELSNILNVSIDELLGFDNSTPVLVTYINEIDKLTKDIDKLMEKVTTIKKSLLGICEKMRNQIK